MTDHHTENICTAEHLSTLLSSAQVAVLDCSWYLPSQQRHPEDEYQGKHIPSAQFFHIDKVCDLASELPHMLPSEQQFAEAVASLGVSNKQTVVVYDSAGIFSAARVWWMFKVFGHDDVRVLNGGLPAWVAAGGDVATNVAQANQAEYCAQLDSARVCDRNQLIDNCATAEFTVLDARPNPRFTGQAPEPRPGLPSGHMPNSLSLPYSQLLSGGKLKSVSELHSIFFELGLTHQSKVVTSCGSGVTAAIITLALAQAGYGMQQLYDGAWAEWGAANDTEIISKESG